MKALAKPLKPRTSEEKEKEKERIKDIVIERVSAGITLAQVVRELNFGLRTWYDWMEQSPELAARFARARELGFDIIAASTLDIADEKPERNQNGGIDAGSVQHAKLRIETRLKLLAKWDPKRYGEKVELSGDAANPIAIQRIERVIVK